MTLPEIRVLHAGYEIMQQRQQDEQKGVSPKDRSRLQDFNQRLKEDDF